MSVTDMIEARKVAGGEGMPDSLDTMAAVRSEGTGIPFAMPQPQGMLPPAMAQGTGIPPAMPPQPMPQAMAQGTGIPQAMTQAMRPSGLAGIVPPPTASSSSMGEAPENNMVLAALETLNKRGQKPTIYKELRESAKDRGVNLPASFSPEMGGLMRLAAEGGPVLYRREGGVAEGPSREEILSQLQTLVNMYGAKVPKIGEPLDYFSNNPLVGFTGGGEAGEGPPYGELYVRSDETPSGILSMSGRGTNRNFEKDYQALASQLKSLESEPKQVSDDFVPLSDERYGSLNDPNLPAMDAAQQRLQYRQNVGFFEKPPGPTTNTRRILSQAYGEESPIYQEILQGLQPTPTQPVSTETAMQAYYGLPGVVYGPEKEGEVEAQTGGGLKDLASGGEFSGRVPGDGGGMEDNVRMPIMEGEEQVATLAVSPTEYVVDSHTMAALGNGNPDKGADYMDEVVEDIREEAYGTTQQPNEIDGLALLQANMMG
jgi:hypothetical protein